MSATALAVVYEKLTGAKRHSETLDKRIRADLYGESDKLYRLIPEFNHDETECSLRVKKVADPPFAEWDAILGDVIHNLRSALDRLAYQLAILNAPSEDPPPGTEFPIFLDQEKFRAKGKGSGAYKVRGIAPHVRDRIESLQPYDAPERPLWVLQQLSNGDKHRLGAVPVTEVGIPIMEGPFCTDCIITGEG